MSRTLRELRFLVTQKCNYNCKFCHGEGLQCKKEDLLTPTDIKLMYAVGRDYFGISTATLTGGEPLMRNDIGTILSELKSEGCNITITTNGSLLDKHIEIGSYINCINLSLHTLNRFKYDNIVQRNGAFVKFMLSLVRFRILYPDVKICLNITVVDGVNTENEDIEKLICFAKTIHASIKFIELFPCTSPGYVSLDDIKQFILNKGFKPTHSMTRKERFSDGNMEIGFIKIFCAAACDTKNPAIYCKKYNDLFVSPDGKIKPCRNSMIEIDILDAIKKRDKIAVAAGLSHAFDMLGQNCVYERVRV